jgi:hypothetical protein
VLLAGKNPRWVPSNLRGMRQARDQGVGHLDAQHLRRHGLGLAADLRRTDSESVNRGLRDTLSLGRARSVGHARQNVNLLGYALMANSPALHDQRRRRVPSAA